MCMQLVLVISCFDVCCIHNVKAVQRQRGSIEVHVHREKVQKGACYPFR